jgi:excisionase family DNA binding protein
VNADGLSSSERRAETPVRPFFSVAETARMLGVNPMTLYRAIGAGEFPAVKIRSRYVVPAKALRAMEADALAGGVVDAADYVRRGAA